MTEDLELLDLIERFLECDPDDREEFLRALTVEERGRLLQAIADEMGLRDGR